LTGKGFCSPIDYSLRTGEQLNGLVSFVIAKRQTLKSGETLPLQGTLDGKMVYRTDTNIKQNPSELQIPLKHSSQLLNNLNEGLATDVLTENVNSPSRIRS
jgi:hypothetical protein